MILQRFEYRTKKLWICFNYYYAIKVVYKHTKNNYSIQNWNFRGAGKTLAFETGKSDHEKCGRIWRGASRSIPLCSPIQSQNRQRHDRSTPFFDWQIFLSIPITKSVMWARSRVGRPKNRTDIGYFDKPTPKPTSVFYKPRIPQDKVTVTCTSKQAAQFRINFHQL